LLKIDKKFPSNQTSPIYKTYPKIKTSTGKNKVHINEGKVKNLDTNNYNMTKNEQIQKTLKVSYQS